MCLTCPAPWERGKKITMGNFPDNFWSWSPHKKNQCSPYAAALGPRSPFGGARALLTTRRFGCPTCRVSSLVSVQSRDEACGRWTQLGQTRLVKARNFLGQRRQQVTVVWISCTWLFVKDCAFRMCSARWWKRRWPCLPACNSSS